MSQKHLVKKPAIKKKAKEEQTAKEADKAKSAEKQPLKLPAFLENSLVLRLVLASLIFAISLIFSLPEFASIILMVISAVAAGYDIVLKAAREVENGNYLATTVVVSVIAVIAFFINFEIEGTALVLLYQIGILLLDYAIDHTKKAAFELLKYQDEDIKAQVKSVIDDELATEMNICEVMRSSAGGILRLAMIFAVFYALALPIVTNFSYIVSVHRALMILLIATPMSVVVSIPVAGSVGLCYCAQQGVVFNKASALATLGYSHVAIFDKAGIFTEDCPRIIALHSDVMGSDSFMSFIAHAVYYSEQPIANAVSAVYEGEYQLDIINDFRDIPGYGVELSVDGIKVCLAVKEYLRSRGVALPDEENSSGQTYYMTVAGRPMGKIVISTEINSELENLVPEMKANKFSRCVLLTEDNKEAGQHFAEMMNFTEMYPQCDSEKKLRIVSEIARKARSAVSFIYSNGIETHSNANLDIRVSRKAKYADAFVYPDYVNNIPFANQVARRVREIAIENALFAFIIKALLIFLSIIGYCNLWFAIFIDFVAAIATILNTIRVTSESLINTIKYKTGH